MVGAADTSLWVWWKERYGSGQPWSLDSSLDSSKVYKNIPTVESEDNNIDSIAGQL